MEIGFFVLLGVLVVSIGYAIVIYNNLVSLKHAVSQAWANIDVLLKQRHDELPKLVETCKQYMKHERETLEQVMKARAAVSDARAKGDVAAVGMAETSMRLGLGNLFAVAEAYPDLKANQNMMQLSEELTSTENKVAFSRQAYNDSCNQYNAYKQTFPPVIFANMFGFDNAEYFEIEEPSQKEAPKVSF